MLEEQREQRRVKGQQVFQARERLCLAEGSPSGTRPRSYHFDGTSEFVSSKKRSHQEVQEIGVSRDESSKAAVLRKLLNDTHGTVPRVLILPSSSCQRSFTGGRPRDLIVLVDHLKPRYISSLTRDLVMPYVVSRPTWMAALTHGAMHMPDL